MHLGTCAGTKVVMRKGEEEERRSVRAVCDVCTAHCDRDTVDMYVCSHGSSLREHEAHFLLHAIVDLDAVFLCRKAAWLVRAGIPKRRRKTRAKLAPTTSVVKMHELDTNFVEAVIDVRKLEAKTEEEVAK